MTVSSQTNNATFVGNGVTTAFPLPFRFFSNGDVFAYFIDSTTGTATPLILGTDYTLTGAAEPEVNGNAVSVLTTTAPLPTGHGLYVERIMQEVQSTDIVNQGEFFASTHEDVFDRLTMLIQQANANSQGAIRVAIGDPEPRRLLPAAQRANKVMSFDSNGDPIASIPVSGTATELAIDLANKVDPTKGAGLVGYTENLAYPSETVGSALNGINEFLNNTPAIGHPATRSDVEDVYELTRRLHELHKAATNTAPAAFELLALRGPRLVRAAQVGVDGVFSVPNSATTAIQWDKSIYDNEAMYLASSPTRLTVPANATVLRVTANVSFAHNATGARGVFLYKNGVELAGCRVTAPAVDGIVTALKLVTDPIQVSPGDYFEVQVFQSSGAALAVDAFSTFSLEVLQWSSRTFENKQLLITQGLYQEYQNGDGITDANLDVMAQRMAAYSVVVLSHVETWTNGAGGCADAKYQFIVRLIRAIRNINPNVKIFGYIEGTASAPSGCGYANGSRYFDNGWTVPYPAKEIERILQWATLPGARPDGIFVDLMSNVYMSAAHRDNIYSAIKGYGFAIMSNTTYPSYLNVRFACESPWFGAGDYCLMEGFSTAAGVSTLADTNSALAEVALWRHKGIRMAALCSEAWGSAEGQTTNIASVNNINAVSLFNSYYSRGDVYQYDTSDLGIVTKIVQTPGI